MTPIREQLGLCSEQACAADDQPPVTEFRFGDLRLSSLWIVPALLWKNAHRRTERHNDPRNPANHRGAA